jgi:hypothetical protein
MLRLQEFYDVTDKSLLRDQVIEWGYPRLISDNEMAVSAWFRYGHGVFWMSRDEGHDDELMLHCCHEDEMRGRPFARDFLAACKTIAQIWDYEFLRVLDDGLDDRISGYLLRLGFTRDHRGLRCRTWEVPHGQTAEGSERSVQTR